MIIPSINHCQSYDEVQKKVAMVADYVDRVHIDVSDGQFVSMQTWPLNQPERKVDEDWKEIINGRKALPNVDSVDYEVHLMVQDPAEYIDEWIAAGVKGFIAHASMIEAPHHMHQRLAAAGVEFGIAITPIEYRMIDDLLFELADFIVVMGFNEIGPSGQKLCPESVELVKSLSGSVKNPIEVDGGVDATNINKLRKSGATRFVSGSAIFGTSD